MPDIGQTVGQSIEPPPNGIDRRRVNLLDAQFILASILLTGLIAVMLCLMYHEVPASNAGLVDTALGILATTAVGAAGFFCGCPAPVDVNTMVEVFFPAHGNSIAAKAQVTRVDWAGTAGQRCDFKFLEKPADWVLR